MSADYYFYYYYYYYIIYILIWTCFLFEYKQRAVYNPYVNFIMTPENERLKKDMFLPFNTGTTIRHVARFILLRESTVYAY